MQTESFGRTVNYVRVSSWGQVGKDHVSLDVQESESAAYIARNGGKVTAILRDEGKSGRDNDNPEYLRLKALVASGQVDTVVVWALDRISRDELEFFTVMRSFDVYGVKLRSATQDVTNRFMTSIMIGMAAEESRKISARVIPAQRARLNSGRWIGRAPLGYRIVAHPEGGKRLEQDPDTAWKVARLFTLYATGEYGLAKLAREAAILGLGAGQSTSNLSRMLTNASYVGKLVWGRRKKQYGADGRRHLNLQAKGDWTVTDGDHDPIVDQATFDACQVVLARNQARKAPRPAQRQLLVGSIFCKCGARIQGVVNGNDGAFYFCPQRRLRQTCDQKYVAAAKFDDQVKATVAKVLRVFVGDNRDAALRELEAMGDDALDASQVRKKSLEASKQKLEGARLNGADLVMRGALPVDLFQAQDARYAAQLKTVETELADLVDVRPMADLDDVLALTAELRDLSNVTTEGWRDLIRATVDRVDVLDEVAQVSLRTDVYEKLAARVGAVGVLA
jgi:site-specific DNA recombinase